MNSRKGQELSIGTLILIVLGIIVLVLLVLGFSIGWQNLFSKIGIASGSDLSAMVAACKVAAASDSLTSYCEFKKVRIGGETKEINCEFVDVASGLSESKLSRACPSNVKNLYKDNIAGERIPVCGNTDGKIATNIKCGCSNDVCDSGEFCDAAGDTKCLTTAKS